MVSELVAIAVEHPGTATGLTLEQGPRGLRVAVRDGFQTGSPRPEKRSADPLRRGLGLGLEMVGSLATAWGVDVQPDGKTAWAEITK